MVKNLKEKTYQFLRWSEKYTKTDMVYLAENIFWLNLNNILTALFSFALAIFFARFVSKETYGIYQFIISLSSIIGAFTLTGMNLSVTQAVARNFEKVFPESVRVQIKFGMIPFIISLLISLYYLINKNLVLSYSLIIVAFLLPLSNALNTWVAFLNGKKDFKGVLKWNIIFNLIYYLGMIGVIIFLPESLFLVIANFLLNTIANLIIYKKILKKYKPNENYEEEAISFGKKISFSNILSMISLNIDNIIIFHFLGSAPLAIYTFASNIPERIMGLLRPISTIALPKFSEKKPDDIKENIYEKTLKFLGLASIFGLIYILFTPLIFKIFFPLYKESVGYSQLYTIAMIISSTANLPFIALYAKRSKYLYITNIIYPITNISMLFLGGYLLGITGVILAKILISTILLLGGLYLNKF